MPASSSRVFGTSVTRFGSIGKEDEEVRGDEPTIRLFNSLSLQTIITIIASSGWRTSGSLSVLSVREGLVLVLVIVQFSDPPGLWVPFIQSLRQSLELDTGVNHHSLALHSTARLRTRSPPSSCRFPTPHSPQTYLPLNAQSHCSTDRTDATL